jgi:lipoate-protein ligase A
MGLDEAILESVSSGRELPTLRLYAWEPAAISIGYFQGLHEEVDIEGCRAHGVDIVRRITGGGAVFHQAEITYSVIIPETHALAPGSIMASYGLICGGVIAGLGILGVDASFAPINDIVSDGRKLSGNAQTRKRGCLLQHGTILLDLDVELMFELLKVPAEKARGRLVAEVRERVTSLSAILGRNVAYAEAALALARGFAKALDLEYAVAQASGDEVARAREIAAAKFADPEWNSRR